ncbi:MAG TPA: glycosyltransferase family 2 protein [Candidatus Dormibacteraeota bacterium]|nr:glycosyltransferase family 2 protein [Candidatus Dormibacteraeota bacterium]
MKAENGEGVLSVVVPVYNEASTVGTILAHVLRRPEVKEVVVVDDGSTDGSWEVIQEVAAREPRVRALRQERNRGKGAALRLAISYLTAPFAVVQDADLEYDPDDYPRLLAPLLGGRADAVNGVRGFGAHTAYSYWFVKGNHLLTTLLNLLFNCYITDLLSGYKVLRTELWRRLNLQSRGFEVETEIVAKVLRLGYRFHEVPITYITRSREDGKKIRTRDAFRILAMQLRVRFSPMRWLFGAEADLDYHRRRQRELAGRHPLLSRLRGSLGGREQ